MPQDFIYKLITVVPMPRANLAHGHHPNEWAVYFVKGLVLAYSVEKLP